MICKVVGGIISFGGEKNDEKDKSQKDIRKN